MASGERERESTPGGFLVPGSTTNPHCRSGIMHPLTKNRDDFLCTGPFFMSRAKMKATGMPLQILVDLQKIVT